VGPGSRLATRSPLTPLRRRGAREVAAFAAAAALFPLVALLTGGRRAEAVANAHGLLAAERALGIDVEAAAHAWAGGLPGVMAAANVVYLWAHVPMTAGALIWIWIHRPRWFGAVRDVFLATHLLTLAGYVLHPTAPPRLMGHDGARDGFAAFWGSGMETFAHTVQSPYAAMPSGHVAWALVAGGAMALLVRQRPLRALCALYPALVVAVTVVTANHFLLDAAAAVAVVAVAVAAVALVPSRRRSARLGPAGLPGRA
jgi:membrane-associated phospholipid phosphatase